MNIWGVIGFVLWSSIKYLVAPPFGVEAGLSFWGIVLGMFVGGLLGVTVFYYLSSLIFEKARLKRLKKQEEAIKAGETFHQPIFTKKNKRLVRLKNKLGIYGVVFIALPFISLPITGLVCAKFFKHQKKTLFVLFTLSLALWSVLLTAFFDLFYHDLRAWFMDLF